MEWFRLYSDMVNNSKVMLMPEKYRWRYIALLCVASEQKERGVVPDDEEVIFKLRITPDEWTDTLQVFLKRGLVEKENEICFIHGWNERQYLSDDSKPRVQKYRRSNATVTAQERYSNDIVTPPEQIQNRTDTEQIQKKEAQEISSDPHKANAVAHLKQLLQKHDPELIKEFDRAPRAPDIEQLIAVAERYGPQMVGDIKGWEAAEKALNWMEQDEFWKQHASVYWLFDVKGGGKKATANLREFSRKKSNGKSIGLAATFGDGNPFPAGETF